MPWRNQKEGWGVYPSVGGVPLLPLSQAVHACSVCDGRGGETEEHCAYYFTCYAWTLGLSEAVHYL